MKPIQRGEICPVTDEDGPCKNPSTSYFFGEGKRAELHPCKKHFDALVDKEAERLREAAKK